MPERVKWGVLYKRKDRMQLRRWGYRVDPIMTSVNAAGDEDDQHLTACPEEQDTVKRLVFYEALPSLRMKKLPRSYPLNEVLDPEIRTTLDALYAEKIDFELKPSTGVHIYTVNVVIRTGIPQHAVYTPAITLTFQSLPPAGHACVGGLTCVKNNEIDLGDLDDGTDRLPLTSKSKLPEHVIALFETRAMHLAVRASDLLPPRMTYFAGIKSLKKLHLDVAALRLEVALEPGVNGCVSPTHESQLEVQLAEVLELLQEHVLAAALYKEAAEAIAHVRSSETGAPHTHYLSALSNAGVAYRRADQLDKAEAAYLRVLNESEEDTLIWNVYRNMLTLYERYHQLKAFDGMWLYDILEALLEMAGCPLELRDGVNTGLLKKSVRSKAAARRVLNSMHRAPSVGALRAVLLEACAKKGMTLFFQSGVSEHERKSQLRRDVMQDLAVRPSDKLKPLDDVACCVCCGKAAASLSDLQKCGRCRLVSYCSRECQAEDWKAHKPACLKKA